MKEFLKKYKKYIISLGVVIVLIIGSIGFIHSSIFDFDIVVSTKIERVTEIFYDADGDPMAYRFTNDLLLSFNKYITLRVDDDDFRTNGFELKYKDNVMYEHHIIKTQGKFLDEYYLVVGK